MTAMIGLVGFAGAFAFAWFTKKPAPQASLETGLTASSQQGADLNLIRPQISPTGEVAAIDDETKKAMTEKQLKNLVYEIREKIEGYDIGADEYIMKPFQPDELRARIKNLIEQRKRLHEHFRMKGILDTEQSKITPVDKKFLQKVYEIIKKNVANSSFDIEALAKNLGVSRSVLHRKIVSLTGEAPGELIRQIRLKKAVELIEQKFGNLSEIALEVGFSNPAYFSEAFKKQYGMTPSQYELKSSKN